MIDAHVHLWLRQNGIVNGLPVYDIGGGRSMFGNEVRQMLPPAMTDGVNSAERLLAHMDFSQIGGAVVTQEIIDGNQDDYLRQVRQKWPERFRVCALYEEGSRNGAEQKSPTDPTDSVRDLESALKGMDGIKICAGRLNDPDLTHHAAVFELAAKRDRFIAIDLADGDRQTAMLAELAKQYPNLRIAIGHFGMVTTAGWKEQIRLARLPNVHVESGGITWLFNAEYYPYPSAVRAILEARDICGIEKLMWGSDYPRTMTAITYRMSWDFIVKSGALNETDRKRFFHDNAHSFYHFGTLPELPHIRHMAE